MMSLLEHLDELRGVGVELHGGKEVVVALQSWTPHEAMKRNEQRDQDLQEIEEAREKEEKESAEAEQERRDRYKSRYWESGSK